MRRDAVCRVSDPVPASSCSHATRRLLECFEGRGGEGRLTSKHELADGGREAAEEGVERLYE